MSRLDDIIELIQTTNEVYFITAPGRVRTAYILVDDIVEIALKSFLQDRTLERREKCFAKLEALGWIGNNNRGWLERYFKQQINLTELNDQLNGKPGDSIVKAELDLFGPLQHWSANDAKARKLFPDVIREVRPFFATPTGTSPHPTIVLLDEAIQRHDTRNDFYHDHLRSGYTINDDRCLRAMCEMFDLMEHLFSDFEKKVKENHIVRCQIGVLRLKRTASLGHRELGQPYDAALNLLKKGHKFDFEDRSVEHSLVHTVSDRFFMSLREQFKNAVAKIQVRVDKIDAMPRPQQKHLDEKNDKQQLIQILQRQLNQINTLLGTP